MASVHDVAAYILEHKDNVTTIQLQKLCYYAQAYALVEYGRELFAEDFQAWENGPVVPALYQCNKGSYYAQRSKNAGSSSSLPEQARDACEWVLDMYGDRTGDELVDLVHLEEPWIAARSGLAPAARGRQVISKESMRAYYSEHGWSSLRIPVSENEPNQQTREAMARIDQREREGYIPRFSNVDELWEALTSDLSTSTTINA